jgi:N-acyl-D-amino-acid deacylase
MVDCLVTGAHIADGSGGPLFKSNISIDRGRLEIIPSETSISADRVIQSDGMIVAPGFIDIHSHNDLVAVTHAGLCDKVSQGVTTEVFGNCGFSAFPVTRENAGLAENLMSLITPEKLSQQHSQAWPTWSDFAAAVEAAGCQANIVGQVGHIMLRSAVMGMSMRQPNGHELATMQDLLAKCLKEGASGLSFGLMYNPSSYAEQEEIRALCQIAADHGAFVSVHLRGYDSKTLVSSMNELIGAAEATGVRLQLSHLSPTGKDAQGLADLMLSVVDQAIDRGVDVALDRYPYEHGMSRLELIFPKWVVSDSPQKMLERLSDPVDLARMFPEIDAFVESIGYDHVRLIRNCEQRFIGKSILEASAILGVAPAAAAAKIMHDSGGFAGIILTLSTMETQERVIQHCRCMVGSDGVPSLKGTHPRTFGTFPRILGPFVRKGVLTIEDAVFKMTGLPAERFGLTDRGRIKNGFVADLVIFDPKTVADRSTFDSPYELAEGIKEVFVAGEAVYRDGQTLSAKPGKVLTCRVSR